MITIIKADALYSQNLYRLEKDIFGKDCYSLQSIVQELSDASRIYYVAMINNEVVGYIGANIIMDYTEIMKIAVSQNHRQKGIAKALFKELSNELQTSGVKTINLEVKHNNIEAISLYTNLGFRQISKRANYYGNNIHAVVLSKAL